MSHAGRQKIFTLLHREILEYRNSLLIAPALICVALVCLMLASVLLANNWTFQPQTSQALQQKLQEEIDSLSPILNALHTLFMVILLLVTMYYLLSCFYQDRRDRSVLFWKTMPVSEREDILAKMATACLVAPAIYVGISFVTQLTYALLGMFLVWRMNMDPGLVILDNINFVSLFSGQLSGCLVWVLWTAPLYAWVLFCSAAARRSPLMLAAGIPLALVVIENIFFGSELVTRAIARHVPYFIGEDEDASLYGMNIDWMSLDYIGILVGLLLATGMLFAAHWFRRRRFEL